MTDEPKKRSKTPRPVESFGPEILAALLKGATDGISVSMPYRTAVRFRLRIHQLREAMRKSAHEKYELCSRVRVSVKWPEETEVTRLGRHFVPSDRSTPCLVLLQPNDTEFAEALRGAGIDPLHGLELDNTPQPIHVGSVDDLAELLKDIK